MQIWPTVISRSFPVTVTAWLFLALTPLPSFSSSPDQSRIAPNPKSIEQQREWFQQARKALNEDKIGAFAWFKAEAGRLSACTISGYLADPEKP